MPASAASNPAAAPRPNARRRLAFSALVLVLALPPLVALWTAVALWLGPPAAWMAVVAAADASVLLGLLRVPPGLWRVALALTFVLASTAAALWLIAAGVVGPAFGLMPWESATRLGPVLFGMVADPWLHPAHLAWLLVALVVAAWWNR